MAVAFEEPEGSPTYHVSRTDITAQRMLKIAWADIDAFVEELWPYGLNLPTPAASFPGRPFLLVDSADFEPFNPEIPDGGGEVPAAYTCAGCKVTINYKVPERSERPDEEQDDDPGGDTRPTDTFITWKVSVGAEIFTIPASMLLWDEAREIPGSTPAIESNTVDEDVNAGKIIPVVEHSITWHYVRYPPWKAIRAMVGKVNDRKFAGAFLETLLFLGAEASREITTNGIRMWTLEYKFSEKNADDTAVSQRTNDTAKGWNFFLRPGYGFERLRNKKESIFIPGLFVPTGFIYELADFSELFKSQPPRGQ